MAASRICSVEGCDKPASRREWCSKHYQRWLRHGDPTFTPYYEGTLCEVQGCQKPAKRLNWCLAHYCRWRRHGDPLGGNTSRGEPLQYLTDIVLPYGGKDCLLWPYGCDQNGYGQIYYEGRTNRVASLACKSANGAAPEGTECAHSCGNGAAGCVNPKHLRWATHDENMADTVAHGHTARGERSPMAIFSREQIREIRSLKGKLLQREIAVLFGTNQQTISDIHRRKSWAWLD